MILNLSKKYHTCKFDFNKIFDNISLFPIQLSDGKYVMYNKKDNVETKFKSQRKTCTVKILLFRA